MKKQIKAEIVADSRNEHGQRITTFVLTYPRFIHAELLTHRLFSRNAASSRAIPALKMIENVIDDPFIPVAWQKAHRGMQGTEYLDSTKKYHFNDFIGSISIMFDSISFGRYLDVISNKYKNEVKTLPEWWLHCRDLCIEVSIMLTSFGVTKQIVNRLLEPFQWYTCLVTATEYDNFFELRCPQYELGGDVFKSKKDLISTYPEGCSYGGDFNDYEYLPKTDIEWLKINKGQGEIHISLLAEAMYDSVNESEPKQLEAGEWHIPFGDSINWDKVRASFPMESQPSNIDIKIATARCARISYNNFEGKDDYEADIKLYDRLLKEGHCFDDKTEILTDKGWKLFKDLTDEKIAAVNTKTGEFNGFEKPIRYIEKNYEGVMYKYSTSNLDLFITGGHKLLGVPINTSSDRKKSYESLEVFEADRKRLGDFKFKTYGEQELKMFSAPKPSKSWVTDRNYYLGSLYGFFIGDGYKSSTNKVKFRLKKKRKITYLLDILDTLNIEYICRVDSSKVTNIVFTDNGFFSSFYDNKAKTIPEEITYSSLSLLHGLFEGLKNSDGSIKRNTWVYDTTSKILNDRILELCPLIGLTGINNPSYTTHYRISFKTNNNILVNDPRSENRVSIKNYKGVVYCVEIPSNGIIVRRNGKTIITHNCSPFEHCARAMSEEEYYLYTRVEIRKGQELLVPSVQEGWLGNFKGFIQLRKEIE